MTGVMVGCPGCGVEFVAVGRRRWCSDACKQAGWRARRSVPPPVVARVAKVDVVYECPACGARSLGVQRCDECNVFCRRVGPGGPCPHCDEPVAVDDLIAP